MYITIQKEDYHCVKYTYLNDVLFLFYQMFTIYTFTIFVLIYIKV